MQERLAAAIVREAQRIGADPGDFATVISFETGGTFDPWQKGPTTQWGEHRGLIQMGEPQRAEFGYHQGMSIEDAVKASADFLVANGFEPGMSGMDLYSTINAGAPGRYNASDEANGGTWGSVADKWNHQMEGHRENAQRLLQGVYEMPEWTGGGQGYDNPNAVPIEATDYMDVEAPTGPNVFEIAEAEAEAPQPYESFWGEVGAAWDSTMTSQAIRWATSEQLDPDWTLPEDRFVEDAKRLPENYHDMLLGAGSQADYERRVQWIEESIGKQERLAAGGWSATGAQLLTGIADPIPLAAGLATGGVGILARGGFAARAAAGAAGGAASGAAVDLASQAVLDDPFADPLMAATFGAAFGSVGGVLARRPATAAYGAEVSQTPIRLNAQARQSAANTPLPRTEGETPPVAELGSMGAARNDSIIDPLIPQSQASLIDMDDADVPTAFGAKLRFDAASYLTTAENAFARLLGFNLFDDAAGTVGNQVTPFSVNTRQTALNRQMMGNFFPPFNAARSAWMKENGAPRLNLIERSKMVQEFNRAVRNYVMAEVKPKDASPHVVSAAKAWQDTADAYRKRMAEAGYADLEENPNYVPLMSDGRKVADYDRRFGTEAMVQMIDNAIMQKVGKDISPQLRRRMAKGYWDNLRSAAYGYVDEVSGALFRGDKKAFREVLNKHLDDAESLTDAEVEQLFYALGTPPKKGKTAVEGGEDPTVPSRLQETNRGDSRLKRRTLLDYNAEMTLPGRGNGPRETLRVADFFEDDMEVLARRYSRSMSGRIAFAETKIKNPTTGELIMDGIMNEDDLNTLRNMLTESYRQSGKPQADYADELKKAQEMLDFGWKRINGIPVWDNDDAMAQWARRLKSLQFIRLMSNMGLNQFQEGWKVMATTGVGAALSQMPSLKLMVKGVNSGQYDRDELLAELGAMTGIGRDGQGTRLDFRTDDDRIGTTASGRFGAAVDNFLDAGSALTSNMSAMRQIQEYQQAWATKAIAQQVLNMARLTQKGDGFDLSLLKGKDRQRLASLGLGQEEADRLFKAITTHGRADGKKLESLGIENWSPDDKTLFQYYIGRYTDRVVQQNDFGSLAKWMSHPVLSMFVQFRSFVYGAWAKSTLYAANHMDMRMTMLLLGEVVMGTATYMFRQAGLLSTEEGREKFIEEELTFGNLVKNGWARTASASALPMFMDFALMANPGFEIGGFEVEAGPQFGNARSSGSPTAAFVGSPVVDQVTSAFAFGRGALGSLVDGEGMTANEIKSGVRALPLPTNWVPLSSALSAMIKDR